MHMYKQTVIVQTTQYETWHETWTQTHATAARECTERARQHRSTTHHDSPASIDSTCADGTWKTKTSSDFIRFNAAYGVSSVVECTASHARELIHAPTHTNLYTQMHTSLRGIQSRAISCIASCQSDDITFICFFCHSQISVVESGRLCSLKKFDCMQRECSGSRSSVAARNKRGCSEAWIYIAVGKVCERRVRQAKSEEWE